MLPPANHDQENDKRKLQLSVVDVGVGGEAGLKEYDPHDHYTSKKPTTFCDSTVHLLKASIGTGILALPSAFKGSGYVFGVGGVVFVCILYTACMHLLIATEYELCRRKRKPNLSYAATVYVAFVEGPTRLRWLAGCGKYVTYSLLLFYQSGACSVYIIFISSNLKQLIDFYYQADIDAKTLMAYITLPLVLLCWVRNLKIFIPLSALAHVIVIVCFTLIFWYVLRDEPSITFENRRAIGALVTLPQFLSTVMFAIDCSGIMLPLKSEMDDPRRFGATMGVLNAAVVPLTLLYAIFGFLGYLKYGDEVRGSITLNLPQNEWLAQGIKGFYSVSIGITYFYSFYVVYDIVWKNCMPASMRNNHQLMWEYVVRTLIPVLTFVFAYAIPDLEMFISLVGAIGISSTGLVIPVVINTLAFWNTFESTSAGFVWFLAKNMTLFVISMVIFVTGVTDSVRAVVELWVH